MSKKSLIPQITPHITIDLDANQSQFDKKLLRIREQHFSPVKHETTREISSSPTRKKQRFRLSQDIKAQQCKQILSKVQNLKIPKEILHNRDRFDIGEYNKFQQKVKFREHEELRDIKPHETRVIIEYYYEERSHYHRELNETSEKFTQTALEIADVIQRRFPFINVIIKNLVNLEEISEFHPYGLFEVQVVANNGYKKGILYSKKVSYLLPSPAKIIQELYIFVEKADLEIELYNIFESVQILTQNGFLNKKLHPDQLEGIEVLLRQKLEDYAVNKEGEFLSRGLTKPSTKNNSLSKVLQASQSVFYTRSPELDLTNNVNVSGEMGAHSKQNPAKTFMVKGTTNSQHRIVFKGVVVDVDKYELEVNPTSLFDKEKMQLSLKQLISKNNSKVRIALKPKNIAQVNINLHDGLAPLRAAIIKVSNIEIQFDSDENEQNIMSEKMNPWLIVLRESENLPGNYALLAEPGIYYIQIIAKGYTTEYHKLEVQRGEQVYEFQMSKKLLTKAIFMAVDMFTLQPLPGIELVIYDQAGHLLSSGITDRNGEYSKRVELMAKIKVHTAKDSYIPLFQEFLVSSTAIVDKIVVKMIAKSRIQENSFEIIAAFPSKYFNIALQAICPDGTVLSEINRTSALFDIEYDEFRAGKDSVNIISYTPDSYHHNYSNGDFEILMTYKNLFPPEMTKSTQQITPYSPEQSMQIDRSTLNLESRRLSHRMSASSLYLGNRVSPVNSPPLSFRGGSINKDNENQLNTNRAKNAPIEDVANIIDFNKCMRVYIIHKRVLQEVLYCSYKNLRKRTWKLGVIRSRENMFVKIDEPNMKHIQADEVNPYGRLKIPKEMAPPTNRGGSNRNSVTSNASHKRHSSVHMIENLYS